MQIKYKHTATTDFHGEQPDSLISNLILDRFLLTSLQTQTKKYLPQERKTRFKIPAAEEKLIQPRSFPNTGFEIH